jgi:hypothetical protein
VDFLICEIEDTILDGLRARRQLPYAHYLCHIFAQLIRPPQFQGTLKASRLVFGSYCPAPEAPVPASAPVFDTQAEDTALHQFEAQDTSVDDDDDDDEFGIPPPPPMPPHSHDHEAGSSRATPAASPTIDPAFASILQTLTQQQAHLAAEQTRKAAAHQQLSERMLSMFQTIQDRQDSLQQQLLQDRAESRAFMTLMLQHSSISIPPVQSVLPPPLQAPVVPARTPCWSFFLSAPAGHPGFHVAGLQLRLPSAVSATSFCCSHYCCGGVCDHFFGFGSSSSAASVRVSTSSSFYSRSWIRD